MKCSPHSGFKEKKHEKKKTKKTLKKKKKNAISEKKSTFCTFILESSLIMFIRQNGLSLHVSDHTGTQ